MKLLIFICLITLTVGQSWASLTLNVKQHTEYLSSDLLQGRGTGSAGIKLASAYIAGRFADIGLSKMSHGSYLQLFKVKGFNGPEANVVGFIKAREETKDSVVFTAHYDGLGVKLNAQGDKEIYHGALDNAVGVAALIELARLYSEQQTPRYNLVFVATSAEEIGLHGVNKYLSAPVFPSENIRLNLNIDGFNVSGKRADYFVMPKQGITDLVKLHKIAKQQGWEYVSPGWENQMNTKFDSQAFLVRGIPAFTIWTGNKLKNGNTAARPNFGAIHSPNDKINQAWDWSGVEEHLLLYKAVADQLVINEVNIAVSDTALFQLTD